MPTKIYSFFIDNELVEYLNICRLSQDSDSVKMFRAWGKCLSEESKQLLALADAIERENAKGAEIEIHSATNEYSTEFYLFGDPNALEKLADEGLIEKDTYEGDD